MSAINNRITALKAKTADLTVKEVTLPESAADPLALFESNSAARSDSSNEWTIDLFPSQVPVIMFLLSLAGQFSALVDHKNHAKSSTATVALYLVTVYHAYFLLNDLHVRPVPSAHAQSWHQTSWKAKFAEFLLTLPVPQAMETIFEQLAATQTDKTKNVFIVPSAAGFQHDIFYGRFFPVSFFTHLHDCIATLPGNSPRLTIFNDLISRVMYHLRPTPTTGFDSVIADLIGITATGTGNTTGHYCSNKFYQMFTAVFNPVLFRDFHRRSSLSTLDLAVPTFKTLTPNAYDVLFSATALNLKELKVVLQSMSTILQGSIPMKKNLRQVITDASGIKAFVHGYSTYAMPTWSSNLNLTVGTSFPTLTALTAQTPFVRATKISFLQYAAPTADQAINDVDITGGTNPAVSARHWPWSLLALVASTTPRPAESEFVQMTEDNEDDHVHPKVLVLDVTASQTVSAHLATLTGKIIESFELDGTTIEIPRHDKSLGMQNCLFADSAVPYKYVIRATRFYPRDSGTIMPPLARAKPVSTTRLAASSLLHDRTQIRLPRMNNAVAGLTTPAAIPGMVMADHWNWIPYIQSFLGLRTVSAASNTDTLDAVNGMQNGRLYLWSPYSYTPYEDKDNEDLLPDMAQSRHYFLSNLRTLFGTDTNLVELTHPFEAMPIV